MLGEDRFVSIMPDGEMTKVLNGPEPSTRRSMVHSGHVITIFAVILILFVCSSEHNGPEPSPRPSPPLRVHSGRVITICCHSHLPCPQQ